MAQPRTARLGLGFIWGVLGFSLIGIIVILSKSGGAPVDEYEQQRAENRLKTRLELEEAAHKKLSEYAWVNKEKGIVAVPIERAMELTVAELQARKVGDSEEKAVIMPTLITPPVPQEQSEAAAEATAPAAEGAEKTTPAEGATAPASEGAAPEATPAAEPATEPAAEASSQAAPEPQSEAPAASEAAPAAPEAPSEP